MTIGHTDKVLRLAKTQATISARDLKEVDAPPRLLARMAAGVRLRRVGRGLYAGIDASPSAHQSVIEVAKRVPRSVVCLLSALEVHAIGTQAPFEVWIALPAGTHTPRILSPALRVVRLSGGAFSEGIEMISLDGTPVRVYSLAKTITDCFKLRSKVGLDVALETLREAWRERKVTIDDLWRYAKINRMTNVMRPYLKALTA